MVILPSSSVSFGVVWYTVAASTRDLGVRKALGIFLTKYHVRKEHHRPAFRAYVRHALIEPAIAGDVLATDPATLFG